MIDHDIPLFRPFSDEREIAAVADVLRSGWWGNGPKTAAFEKAFADFVHAKHAVALNSATSALHLALILAGAAGGEVVTTPMTFVSTNAAILYAGATPVFADVEADTLNIDPADVARKITRRTRAVIAVDYGGHPADLDALLQIAEDYHIVFIEDAAHAAGADYHGQRVGSIAPLTCFSFHPVKNLATGDGGMITLDDEDWAERLRRLRWLGIDKDTWTRSTAGEASRYAWQYEVAELGYKYHANDLMSAIGLVQLERLALTNARRRAIAALYDEGLRDLGWLETPTIRAGVVSARHNYVIRCDERDELAAWLRERRIATGVHYIPNHLHALFQPYVREPLPVVEREWTRLLTLPLFPGMTDAEVQYIMEAIRAYPARQTPEIVGVRQA